MRIQQLSIKKLLKAIVFIWFLFHFEDILAQNTIRQIGTSIWVKDGNIYIENPEAYIITYDKLNKKRTERKLYPDSSNNLSDTSFVELDSNNRLTYYSQEGYFLNSVYDSVGNLKETRLFYKKISPTIITNFYTSYYDQFGRIVKRESVSNGKANLNTKFEYRGDTIIEIIEEYITKKTVRNKFKQITFFEEISFTEDMFSQESYTNEFDSLGNLITFMKYIDHKLVKETNHFYINGIESHQIEKFYTDGNIVITTFRYEYW